MSEITGHHVTSHYIHFFFVSNLRIINDGMFPKKERLFGSLCTALTGESRALNKEEY
jgi:hypothetical protein